MAIISFSKDALIDYIPAYGGNRESENPCVVRLRFVPFSKVQEYERLIMKRAKDIRNDPLKANEVGREVQKKEFIENVESVSGYLIDGCEVTSPEEFYETADADLIVEIIKAMESASKLSEGQRKNSSGASAGA